MYKLVICDDEQIMREAVASIFMPLPDFSIVGMASDGEEAQYLCITHSPHLVLMDAKMPVCDGIKATHMIKSKNSSIKILMMSSYDDHESFPKAVANGVDGFVTKNIEPEKLIRVAKNILDELSVFQPQVIERVKDTLKNIHPNSINNFDYVNVNNNFENKITVREYQVLDLVARGLSNKEIASTLNISTGRVKNILSNLFIKTHVNDRTQLALVGLNDFSSQN